jgi:hypothetical protein
MKKPIIGSDIVQLAAPGPALSNPQTGTSLLASLIRLSDYFKKRTCV